MEESNNSPRIRTRAIAPRRGVLRLLSFVPAYLLLGKMPTAGSASSHGLEHAITRISRRLVANSHFKDLAKTWLASVPDHTASGLQAGLVHAVEDLAGRSGFGQTSVVATLEHLAREDFREYRIVVVNGWRLSQTEVHMAALGYRHKTQNALWRRSFRSAPV